MRLLTVALAFFALLALICGAWFLTQGGPLSPEEAVSRTDEIIESVSPTVGPGALPEVADSSIAPAGDELATDRTAVPEGTPVAAEEGSTRQIGGRVVDEFGSPVAAARIFLAKASSFGRASLEARANVDGPFGRVLRTDSDGQGSYQLESSLRGSLDIEVHAPGFAPLNTTLDVEGGDLAQLEDLVLQRGVFLSGHVVDEAGNGIPGVRLQGIDAPSGGMQVMVFGGNSKPLAITGPGGAFEIDELSPGPFSLQLQHDKYPGSKEAGNVERAGQSLTGLRYVLEDGFQIGGLVRDLEPGDNAKHLVRARPMSSADDVGFASYSDARTGEIGSDGRFRIEGLREGKHTLHVIDAGGNMPLFANARSGAVRVETGVMDAELRLRASMSLTFQVVDGDSGDPLTHFMVEHGSRWLQPYRDADRETVREFPGGRVTMENMDVQAGSTSTRVQISADGYAALLVEDVELTPGVVRDLGVLRLQPVPIIFVEVLDSTSGEPIEGARVTLSEMAEGGGPGVRAMSVDIRGDEDGDGPDITRMLGGNSNSAKTNADGIAEVASLPGELCQLKVTHREYAETIKENINLGEHGREEVLIKMSMGGTVVVTVLDSEGEPKKGARVRRSLVGQNGPMVFGGPGARKTKSDGTVTFKHLPAGRHNFKIDEGGGGSMFMGGGQMVISGMESPSKSEGEDVLVVEGEVAEVTLRARPEGSITGTITEGGQPLAGAKISFAEEKDGDSGSPFGRMALPGMGGGSSTRSDGAGKYSLEGLKVARYTVTVEHSTRAMAVEFEVDIRTGKNSEDFGLSVAVLEGRVLDSEGQPAVGVLVKPERFRDGGGETQTMRMMMIVDDGGGGSAVSISNDDGTAITARTDEGGRYTLRGVTPDVELVVETSSDRYQDAKSEPVLVGENQTRSDVDVRVYTAGSLRILVRDGSGESAGFCMAELEYVGEADPAPEPLREIVGEQGETTVKSLRPGIWRIATRKLAMGGPNAGGGEAADPVEIEVLPGETVEVLVEFD